MDRTSSFIITCPACGTKNRIPASREGQAGRCGSCKAKLPPANASPEVLNDKNFDSFLAAHPGPVLAEFWAPW